MGASDDLGADPRLVTFMQYLRLTLVVAIAPLAVRVLFAPSGDEYGASAPLGFQETEVKTTLLGVGVVLAIAAVGAFAGVKLKLPAGALIGPLLIALALRGAGVGAGLLVPGEAPRELAFGIIGLYVGLRFNRDTVRRARGLAWPVLVLVVGVVAACAVFGYLLSLLTGLDALTAYLATTPGGISAVLVTAVGAGAKTTVVFAVQSIRLLLMVLAAPPLVRWLVRSR